MEIRIGVQNVTREIVVETDKSSDDISALVTKALSGGVLDLMDVQGRRVVVPSSALAYVQIGEEVKRRVGFGD
ncbi:DUF3107 domain-containing protein [Demequina lutea]|uniref:ATP-binding protein n=1 Tax=Demequina lutea TaxID=431489 RepID=A0A7Y9Z8G0_9MICO|nr:DUF3107 domain-containing protein [Demequina lutea]NYI40747.1 hypothetical protein [Demequina lutea]